MRRRASNERRERAREQARPGWEMKQPTVLRAIVFAMDGVVTHTADLHAEAWKALFEAYLDERENRGQGGYLPFDIGAGYLSQVDPKPRCEGMRLSYSRGIDLPYGASSDGPDRETVCGLAHRRDRYVERRLRARPPEIATRHDCSLCAHPATSQTWQMKSARPPIGTRCSGASASKSD